MRGSGQPLPITLRLSACVLGRFSHTTCYPLSCALRACFSDRSVSGEQREPIGAPLAHSTFSRQKATNRPRRPFRHADACHLPRAARGRLFIHGVTIGAPPQSCENRYNTVSIGVSVPVRAEREPAASRLPSISYTTRSSVRRYVSRASRIFAPAIR